MARSNALEVTIGIGTATEQGLVVPVIKGADHLNVKEIAQARYEFVHRARGGKLTIEDVSGGTFTISNLGMYGVDLFSGIINPPQSALLAIGRIKERPYGINGQVRLHPTFYATLSVDHRVMDGAQAAILPQRIGELVEQSALLVL
jgi:pyruvate dehydrogenase E2 component (dihydrolipoamide acetyltransferase)